MEDPRKKQMRNIIDNVYHLNKRKFFHMRQIEAERKRLQQLINDDSINHKKIEQMQKINGFQWMLTQAMQQLQSECDKLQTFLDFNDDLKDSDCFEEAKKLLEAANSQGESQENQA